LKEIAMSLLQIVRALGGDLFEGGRRANVPAPGHSPADRSVSLLYENDRVVAHCFGEGDWKGVLDDLRGRGLIDGENRPTSLVIGSAAARVSAPPASRALRIATAQRLWDLGRPLGRSPAATYLRRRGVVRALPGPDSARYLAEAPTAAYAAKSRTRPALMLGVRGPDGALSAVELTFVTPGGHRATDLRLSRKTVGVMPPSCAVRFDAPGRKLLVAEGGVTTLVASQRFDLPAWALLSTSNLRGWSAPEGVEAVLIAGDNGADGEASAARLAVRLEDHGVGAELVFPPAAYGDWPDLAAAERAGRPLL
jgi:putative DNA primase/helicase